MAALSVEQFKAYVNNLINKWWEETAKFSIDGVSRSPYDAIKVFFKKTRDLEAEVLSLKNEIFTLKKQLGVQQHAVKQTNVVVPTRIGVPQSTANPQRITSVSSDQTVKIFNEWARNPKTPLPAQFSYAEGNLKLREKQEIQYTRLADATWIVNKTGTAKYLFPNPNAIDELSGRVDTLYRVTGNRRGKGQNRINVEEGCIVIDEGWIEYKGELSFI